jgi:aldose 1-epimerase
MTNEHPLHTLQNAHWQVGILPQAGGSVAFGRVRYSGNWLDLMRPTAESDYGNASNTACFLMLPWANRIKDAQLRFAGNAYQLKPAPDDGTARHGDVRKRPWQIAEASEAHISLTLHSADFEDIAWPFAFRARLDYRLDDSSFSIRVSLTNADSRPMPAGFGLHPYFVRPGGPNRPQVQIPCDGYFDLTDFMATGPAQAVPERLDFRRLRPLDASEYDDLLTHRRGTQPARIVYPAWKTELAMHADEVYQHMLIFTPQGKPFFALEPQTNANDGFNLYDRGVAGSGVFVLEPGATKAGTVRLSVRPIAAASTA